MASIQICFFTSFFKEIRDISDEEALEYLQLRSAQHDIIASTAVAQDIIASTAVAHVHGVSRREEHS